MRNKIKKLNSKNILFIILIILFFTPLIQGRLKLFDVTKLHKVKTEKKQPIFSFNNWFNGVYQAEKEEFFNENFGFRNTCVRINNQIDYSFFNKANAKGVIIGKKGYLFERVYIKSFYGVGFLGDKKIEKKVNKLKSVQDTLKKLNIDLIVVIAPGKGLFYPEYIPEDYLTGDSTKTSYKSYIKSFKKNKISFIDFNKMFLQMKGISPYPVIPKTGIHWSRYGSLLAADSIIRFIENKRDIKMPQIKTDSINLGKEIKYYDNDLEKAMNLFYKIPNVKMAYPKFKIIKDSLSVTPNVLTVGDSFFWDMYHWGLSRDVFNDSPFWYYNKSIHYKGSKLKDKVENVNVQSEVEKSDVVMLLITEANLTGFAFGFIDELYETYYTESVVSN